MIKHTFFFWLYKWVVCIVVFERKQTDPVLVFPIYNTEYYLVWNQCMVENKLCVLKEFCLWQVILGLTTLIFYLKNITLWHQMEDCGTQLFLKLFNI